MAQQSTTDMTTQFQAADEHFAKRIQDSLSKQNALTTIGAWLEKVEPGMVEIHFAYHPSLTQQHGFIHAGIMSTVLDSACGYAAYSLMPADAGILTIEFKVNLLSPAKGELFIAKAKVKKPGRTITVSEGEAYAVQDGKEKLIATMTGTLMTIAGRSEVIG